MTDTRLTRRGLIAGAVAVAGALAARAAEAFTLRDRLRFRAASELLDEFGVTVHGATARDHDVLVLDVVARPDIQYDEIVRERTRTGEIEPCMRTSNFGGVETFSLFDAETGGEVPSYTTRREGGVVTSAHFHPRVSDIVPCLRTTVTGDTQASLELFDLTDSDPGLIVPCLRVDAAMTERGALEALEVAVEHDETFTVRVLDGRGGELVYELQNGELVPVRDTRV